MSGSDPNHEAKPTDLPDVAADLPADEMAPSPAGDEPVGEDAQSSEDSSPRRILIGSQRDPDAYRPKPRHDWKPIAEGKSSPEEAEQPPAETPAEPTSADPPVEASASPSPQIAVEPSQPAETASQENEPSARLAALAEAAAELDVPQHSDPVGRIPPPNIRDQLPEDLEEEFSRAVGDVVFDDLMAGGDALAAQVTLEEDSQHTGRVVTVRQDDVFVELGSREQGVISARQFEEAPEPGTELEVVVRRFNTDEGLYELTLPNAAADVSDWDDLQEGMIVAAQITGHNTGGLECEVNHLRGFIPISQIALYRVEDIEPFVGEKFNCVVTEANPQRRNLVLSRRAVLEREREEARQELFDTLAPGQVHEGVVRKLMDFGAFVDLGGVDGLLHVSQLAWHRVNHPRDVLSEGQTIKVKIEKFDRETGKMSLAYREMLPNPWDDVEKKFPPNTVVKGTVSKLMEFGAFVQLEPGVEGLVHVSELSYKRVWRPGDVVSEGEEVEVLVLAVDPNAQRISLSMKQLGAPPEPVGKDDSSEAGELPKKSKQPRKSNKPLLGGLGRSTGGEEFGLKW